MFRVFGRQSRKNGLERSRLYNERDFYRAFARDLKMARRSVIIESPFVTLRRACWISELLEGPVKRGVRVTVYTRHPDCHDKYMATKSKVGIDLLRAVGSRVVLSHDFSHWKLAFIDDSILWEGSLNILSQSNSKEIMRRTAHRGLCRQMRRFVASSRVVGDNRR